TYRLIDDCEREIVKLLAAEVGRKPRLIVQTIIEGDYGQISEHYEKIKERTAVGRINEILSTAARKVANARVNNSYNFEPLPTDTIDYVSYSDGTSFSQQHVNDHQTPPFRGTGRSIVSKTH
ncbi:unnamed protein product, partial [Didymodactylos carnosus]